MFLVQVKHMICWWFFPLYDRVYSLLGHYVWGLTPFQSEILFWQLLTPCLSLLFWSLSALFMPQPFGQVTVGPLLLVYQCPTGSASHMTVTGSSLGLEDSFPAGLATTLVSSTGTRSLAAIVCLLSDCCYFPGVLPTFLLYPLSPYTPWIHQPTFPCLRE